jgi:hypothetical protein
MNRLVFKVQNMVHMHKGLYMKISIMVAYKKINYKNKQKKLTRIQSNLQE